MANNQAIVPMPENFGIYKSGGQDITLTPEIIRQNFGNGLTDVEILNFGYLCQTNGLNPFMREAYVTKYGNSPASFIIAKQGYSNRGELSGHLKSKQGGIIEVRAVMRDGVKDYETKMVNGEYVDPGWQVWGAWAIVERDDRDKPFEARVLSNEYSQSSNPLWKTKPCTMLVKVAMTHALREAFPCSLPSNTYYEDEFEDPQRMARRAASTSSKESFGEDVADVTFVDGDDSAPAEEQK